MQKAKIVMRLFLKISCNKMRVDRHAAVERANSDGDALAGRRREPLTNDHGRNAIAIVGIGCRFPMAGSPDAFWRLMTSGTDAITEIPRDRFDAAALYDPRPGIPGKISTRWGGFLDRVDLFDAEFFGISPREADRMDPQQRLLLEVTWEAFEDGGMTLERLEGSQAGVFIGMWLNDYETRLFRNPPAVDFYMTTGTGRYTASGRLSYTTAGVLPPGNHSSWHPGPATPCCRHPA